MKKGWIITVATVALFGANILLMGMCASPVEAKTYNFTYSNFFPPTHIQAKVPDAWAKEIEKLSNGQIKITSVNKNKITVEAPALKKTVKSARMLFWVRMY